MQQTLKVLAAAYKFDLTSKLTVNYEGIELAKGARLIGALTPKELGKSFVLDFFIEASGVEPKLTVELDDHILYPRPIFRWKGDAESLAERIMQRTESLTLSAYEFTWDPKYPYYELEVDLSLKGRQYLIVYKIWDEPYCENSAVEDSLFKFISFTSNGEHSSAKETILKRYWSREPQSYLSIC